MGNCRANSARPASSNRTRAARMFSARCWRVRVPGMRSTLGARSSSHASRDFRGSCTQAVTKVDEDGTREDRVLNATRPPQRAERYEGDALRSAVVQETERALISQVEQILHADDLCLAGSSAQVLSRYVAQTDPADQTLVTGPDKCRELSVEAVAGFGCVHDPKVHRRQPIQPERHKVLLDAHTQLIWFVVGKDGSCGIATSGYLADDRQVTRIRVQRFTDDLVYGTRPVVLRSVDMVDAAFDRVAQHSHRFVAVSRRSEDVIPGQLHSAVSDPHHLRSTEGK